MGGVGGPFAAGGRVMFEPFGGERPDRAWGTVAGEPVRNGTQWEIPVVWDDSDKAEPSNVPLQYLRFWGAGR